MTKVIASHWELIDKEIKCNLCPLHCVIPKNKSGVCRFRTNINNQFYLTNYGEIAELALEQIEKKPLHHFCPGSKVISIGTNGCNMGCTFCQNYEVSQLTYKTKELTFEEILTKVKESKAIGVCFTYNEPFIWFEYVKDLAAFLKAQNLKVIINTNGLINEKPLLEILPKIDALNLDIKAFTDHFYQKICKAPLMPVLETAKILKYNNKHFEISHLVIPKENDEDTGPLANWILNELGDKIPIHINAYYPRYLMTQPSTPESLILEKCALLKQIGHKFVYGNNIASQKYHNTNCLKCDFLLVKRDFYKVTVNCQNGICPKCGEDNYILT